MKRWQVIFLGVVLLVGIAVFVAYGIGTRMLQAEIARTLGPGGRLSQLKVHWFSLELSGVSIDAPKGWPAARTLEAERMVIVPDLRSIFGNQIRISSIVVEKPYLSVLRTPGKLRMIPNFTERPLAEAQEASSRILTIASIELKDGNLELYDATVSRPPLLTRVEKVEGVIRDIALPASPRTRFELAGVVKGITKDGHAQISGWIEPGARDSSSKALFTTLDLVALQPYLIKKNEARINQGTLDLNFDSEVRNNKLAGKGKIVLKQLEFAPSRGLLDSFMGLPRNAVIKYLKDRNGVIDIDFNIEGDISQPQFSLRESLATRIATAMAEELGVSIKSVAGGIGTVGQKTLQAAGSAVESIGSAVKDLFGGAKKRE